MSGRTWLMMALMLGLNWGGFIALLLFGIRREAQKRRSAAVEQDSFTD
ncbi:MAG: hypothetical protein QF463_03135 [Vicinamibacterales bacterium]|jgi:hypothetical protein|nr:hypothetical protein [Vicinamibacterales bacterium]MDP6608038.1 hypothetical protein [Vicinamibacterales bacterium]|tara:strand:+ start:2307 stop:2450 length:144 start_codon:yes stop_codon:yes gene_type:complete